MGLCRMENTGLWRVENTGLCRMENTGLWRVENTGLPVSGGEHGTEAGGEHGTDCGGWRTRDCVRWRTGGLWRAENTGLTVAGGEHGTVAGREYRTDCGRWRTRDCGAGELGTDCGGRKTRDCGAGELGTDCGGRKTRDCGAGELGTDCGGRKTRDCGGGEHGTVGENSGNRRPAHACSVTAGPADRIKVCNGWATDTRLATGTRRRPDDSYRVPDTSISCIPGISSVRASLSGRVRAAANAVPVMRSAAAVEWHRLTDSPQKRQSCTAEHATHTTISRCGWLQLHIIAAKSRTARVLRLSFFFKACVLTSTEDVNSVPVQCCFTSTEAVRTIRDWEPSGTATSTFTQLLSSVR